MTLGRIFASSMCAIMSTGALADGHLTKIADMEQGAEIAKCFKISDWNTKTADDALELMDRDANGCCAEGYVPGVDLYAQYFGAQVVCGVDDDGSISGTSYSTANGNRTCEYKKCFVMKIADKIVCKDDGVPLLNGCCGLKDARNFHDDCMMYDYNRNMYTAVGSGNGYESAEYCLTYNKNYGTIGYSGTAEATDDVADGKFQVDKFYAYAPCAEGGGGDSTEPADASSAYSAIGTTVTVAAIAAAAAGAM